LLNDIMRWWQERRRSRHRKLVLRREQARSTAHETSSSMELVKPNASPTGELVAAPFVLAGSQPHQKTVNGLV
jgi:hypothetical protein